MGNNILLGLGLCLVIWIMSVYFRNIYFLHMLQLEEYNTNNYISWIKNQGRNKVFTLKQIINIIITAIFIVIYSFKTINIVLYIGMAVWAITIIYSIDFKKKEVKKPLVYTKRAKRLCLCSYVLLVILFGIFVLLFKIKTVNLLLILLWMSVLYFYVPYNMALASVCMKPIENRINKYYYDMAYNKVRKFENLKIVGITGSFGKTTTKFITNQILKQKYNVLMTPNSFNTPMGISKVVNNTLSNEHEAFVVEMGARKIGEIEEVAKLANPKIGVLTSIGPTHLETFKNLENISKTKYELIEELPTDGIAIFNYDNNYIKKLADKTFKEKILYGLDDVENLDLFAQDIKVFDKGSIFTLKDKEGNSIVCKSKLLGKHNISNLLAGAAVARALGLTFEEIRRGIETVEPVPHRLQLIDPGTGVIVIDDAFNSNPVGCKAALDVISNFKEGNKIVVTPGMVELGLEEDEANKEFGHNMAEVCDYIILVGRKKTQPIYEGLKEKSFDMSKVFVVNSLNEATVRLQSIVRPKDVVLFENDLPDTFNEN
ncbi:UDP-N-acetylmuramoyl-tripeptide--D-alanyl-D-alanine ligase [Abyssisolibacter fermentans]|uniref:UDP-N-acetylmuramoyl-tripeptide--D-alanyl-D- alanine ligase n=1 Tax=Abyssisolibacter fermentans TaxID=1766203 RepID=UPI0008306D6B|nr:UDP-N-acetylmuramoyl-tripeptide--D-alanyl-D-alanine ligase [Abyssisolibacter fermentans]